jgi:transposase-like protein
VSQKPRKYSMEFRARALELLKSCSSVSGLARELGIRRKWLYEWRNQARAKAAEGGEAAKVPEAAEPARDRGSEALRGRIAELERLVGRQAAEIDFFRSALRRVEERRQRSGRTGGGASTRKSGS